MEARMNPGEMLIEYFGGVYAAGKALRRHPSALIRWRRSGQIPVKAQRIILEGVKNKNWNFTAEDLILGKKIKAKK